ncbi:MAG: mannose-6-phosphate isomerase, partial [Clostridia bacterium]|nr:mannose-6-phosphate isomerase [Clostridia bacterium]
MGIYFLKPALKETIWGGNKLKSEFKMESDLSNIAEAWMLSCHEDGESTVIGGEYDSITLSKLIEDKLGFECLGTACSDFKKIEDFPILIKLIDADDKLSVQVHPDDEYAAANEKDVR